MQMPAIPNAEIQPHAKSAMFAKGEYPQLPSFGFSRRAAAGAEHVEISLGTEFFQMKKRDCRAERKEMILHPTGESNLVRETAGNPQNLRASARDQNHRQMK